MPGWVPLIGMGPFVLSSWWPCWWSACGLRRTRTFPRIGRFANALYRDLPAERCHPAARQLHGAARPVRLLAADALFRVHRAIDPAARLLAFRLDGRGGGGPAIALAAWLLPLGARRQRRTTLASTISAAASCCWERASSPGSWPAACGGSSRIRSPPRRRATVSPICSASMFRRQWSIGCWRRKSIRRARCARYACCSSTSVASRP